MTLPDKADFTSPELSLEPMDTGPIKPVASGKSEFHPNTRKKTERRVLADRREQIRFEADRRAGKDRRPKKSWEPGNNL
jgi:hypothetical protein